MTTKAARRRGRLLLVGGAEDRSPESEILRRLVDVAGGKKARILVCGAASNDPLETLSEYSRALTAIGAAEVWTEPFEDRHAGEDEELLRRLEAATAVFFSGGDQFRLISNMAGTRFSEGMKARFNGGDIVIAGTSAGAAAMSSTMIVAGPNGGSVRRSDVKLGIGLGMLRDSVVDTHFNERGRVHRLLTVFAQNPQILGIGLDENTAVDIMLGERMEVLGSGAVTIFDGRVGYSNSATAGEEEIIALSGVRLHVLPRGFAFDTRQMEMIVPAGAPGNEGKGEMAVPSDD